MSVADGVRVELYDTTGVTRISVLNDCVRNVSWQHTLSRNGAASFEVDSRSAKAADLTDRRIVKFRWQGQVFGCVLGASEKCTVAVDGGRWLRFEGLPGVGSLLGEGALYPEYGIARTSSSTRRFGHMSKDVSRTSYVTPLGVTVASDSTKRKNYPPEAALLAPSAYWIGYADPTINEPPGAKFWAYGSFTTSTEQRVAVLMAFDNDGQGYLDGELLFEASGLDNWQTFKRYDTVLASGTHTLASAVTNGPDTTGTNALAFLCLVVTLDAAGGIDGTSQVIFKTDLTHWKVSPTEPGFARGQILALALTESRARSERGPGLLASSFTTTTDTNAVAWADSGAYEEQILNGGLDELAAKLSTTAMDWLVDADGMKVGAYARYGVNRTSGAGAVRLMLAANLTGYETERRSTLFTVATGQLGDGSWIEVSDSAAVTAYGRIVTGVSLGGTSAVATATGILQAALAQSAAPQISDTTTVSPYVGARLGVDYWLGDTILKPGHRGVGTIKSRVMSVTVDASGDVVQSTPQFVQDGSA